MHTIDLCAVWALSIEFFLYVAFGARQLSFQEFKDLLFFVTLLTFSEPIVFKIVGFSFADLRYEWWSMSLIIVLVIEVFTIGSWYKAYIRLKEWHDNHE